MSIQRLFNLTLLFFFSHILLAETKIAILDFELKDLTLAPGITSEIKRMASIKPLLETELKKAHYVIIKIDRKSQTLANSCVGYLFGNNWGQSRIIG